VSRSRLLISTLAESWSQQSRKSRHFQKVSLDFVSTPPSSPKSLDRDREICRDMKFLANLDSLSRSRSRVSQFYHISRSRFLNLSRFFTLKFLKKSRNLDKSQKVSTDLENLGSLDLSRQSRQKSRYSQVSIEKSRFKKSRPRKKIILSRQ
jgi:hypothetical protein